MRLSIALLILALGAILAAAIHFALQVWASYEDVVISSSGTIFMVMGIVLSLAVGGGLMALVFYSRRKGFDDDTA